MARPSRRQGNLPAEATSFVGRRRELSDIRKKLIAARLVTLVGPGGVGKTRLALRAATELGRGFTDGAWLVELADVRDPALVSNAVVSALDLRDQTATEPLAIVLGYLKDKQILLVVDNCEHVLEAAGRLVSEVLKAAPGVHVIATSREPLSAPGEHVVPVPPLELPAPHADEPLSQVQQNEAVMLFTVRAAAASGRFELTASNQAVVADLCRRLDGLPLAIELAAVRTRVLSVEQILDRLTDRFGLLTAGGRAALPRHQTLRTTIDWSYDLLTDGERTILRRLCVFAGRFTLEDVEQVCAAVDAPAPRTLDLVSSLVDKSLVLKEDVHGQACYRLHETMREYAGLSLREVGEEEAFEARCATYYRMRCLRAAPEVRYRLAQWLEWMDLEIDNVRAVLQRFVTRGEYASGIDLAVGAGWYWITRATTEGARWFDQLLATGQGNPETLGWAYFLRGFLAVLQSDLEVAAPSLERALAIARETGQRDVLCQSLCMASIAADMSGDRASARRLLDEARADLDGVPDPSAPIAVLQAQALRGLLGGDVEVVIAAAEEGIRLSRDASDLYALEMMSMNRGYADLIQGEFRAAKTRFAEALQIAHQIDDRVAQYALLYALGSLAAATNQARLAAQLLGGADAVRIGAGAGVIAYLAPLIGQATESASEALGAARFHSEFQSGALLGRDAVVALALGEPGHAGIASPDAKKSGPLGQRESEVAKLVADGLSNKQIGARLFISERTVDSHVRNILNKLGFNSRAQIAAWMAAPDH